MDWEKCVGMYLVMCLETNLDMYLELFMEIYLGMYLDMYLDFYLEIHQDKQIRNVPVNVPGNTWKCTSTGVLCFCAIACARAHLFVPGTPLCPPLKAWLKALPRRIRLTRLDNAFSQVFKGARLMSMY